MDALHDNVLNADERAQWAARPPETVLLKAGHVAFHHALTVHGSFGNRSDKPRRALVLNFFADGTKALMDGTLLKGAPAVAKGQTFHSCVGRNSHLDAARPSCRPRCRRAACRVVAQLPNRTPLR